MTIQDIYIAYRKFKSHVYYDSASLFLRKSLVEFEMEHFGDIEISGDDNWIESYRSKFNDAFSSLLNLILNPVINNGYLQTLLDKVEIRLIPKNFKQQFDEESENKNANNNDRHFLTNEVRQVDHRLKNINAIIDCPIELHVLSVLWILNVGVKFTSLISKNNYANRLSDDVLALNESDRDNHLSCGLSLFKPYYKGYQDWRDNGIKIAQKNLEDGQDVTILSIDVKRYYYTVDIELVSFIRDICNEEKIHLTDIDKNLNSILSEIHKSYHKKLKESSLENEISEHPLPIGLASSGILANLYLKEFDRYIEDDITPTYYGRYVDDILMVFVGKKIQPYEINTSPIDYFISKHLVRATNKQVEDILKGTENTTAPIGNFMIKREVFITKKNDGNDEKSIEYKISVPCHNNPGNTKNLTVQQSKVIMDYFVGNGSMAAINKFVKALRKNSSEFRLLPFESAISKEFDDEAFRLEYTDSIHKLRSLKGISEDRYGASKYLAHKLFLSVLPFDKDDKERKNAEESARQILSYFQGVNTLNLSNIWEKVSTYFIINQDFSNLRMFITATVQAIDEIRPVNNGLEKDIDKVKEYLLETLEIGIAMGMALSPITNETVLNSLSKCFLKSNREPIDIIKVKDALRSSYLFRHKYQYLKAFCFTLPHGDNNTPILGRDILHTKVRPFNENLAMLFSPVFVHIHDIALIEYFHAISSQCGANE